MYFRFVTLVAFHAFLSLKVDATVLEVGVGGEYDCTNIVPKPIVTAVSALGIDHTAVLGKTLPEIAWQKGGIYKKGVPALTVNQPTEGAEVLKQRASEKEASEFLVAPFTPGLSDVKLGLSGSHQYQNANLAVHIVNKYLSDKKSILPESGLSQAYITALQNTKWPGRCQTVSDPQFSGITWHLDGAHTSESLECCMQWFVSTDAAFRDEVQSRSIRPQRVLIFNCTSGRSGNSFLGSMISKTTALLALPGSEEEAATFFDVVVFCANVTYADGGFKGDLTTKAIAEDDLAQLKTQSELARAWQALVPSFPKECIHVLPSIEHSVRVVRDIRGTEDVDVLVCGSLHLVGGVIEVAGLSQVAL